MKIIGENEIEERYTGMQTKDYTGHYNCDGNSCNCTWYKTHFFCRHIIFTRKKKGLPIYENKIFNKTFRSGQFSREKTIDNNNDFHSHSDEEDDEEDDGEVPDTEQPVPPASPGMEVMLKEKNEANKRLPKNVKFNQSFDVGKQCADYLKHAPSATFDNYLECYKSFARFLRDGMPSNVMDFLMNPSKYDLTLKEMPSVRVEEDDDNLGHDQQLSQQEEMTI